MANSLVREAFIGLIIGSFVALEQAHASIHPLTFEESVQGVFRQLYAPVEGFGHKKAQAAAAPAVPYRTLLDVSNSVLDSDEAAARELAHLRPLAGEELSSPGGWEEFSRFEGTLSQGLRRKGVFFSPGMRRKIYVVGSSLMWHQAQHHYDSLAPAVLAAEELGATIDSVEREKRGWDAGCAFWRASARVGASMGAAPQPDALGCDKGFPKIYHCKYRLAAEEVVVSSYRLQLASKPGASGDDGAAEARLEASGAELKARCAELERAEKGNPLSLEGFRFEWSLGKCIDRAVGTVNAPGWKSSLEICPAAAERGAQDPMSAIME